MLRDFLIAVSLANLCFIRVWPEILNDMSADPYYLKTPLSMIDVAPLFLAIGLLALAMWIGIRIARRARRDYALNLARGAFLLVLTIPLNGVRGHFDALSLSALLTVFGQAGTIALLAAVSIPAGWAFVRWYSSVVRVAAKIVLILSPFVLYTFSQSLWPLVQRAGMVIADAPSAMPLPAPQPTPVRILWLVFDELDQFLMVDGRPSTVQLPEVDRFRRESIYVTKARSPARKTEEAIPALITGRMISDAEPAGPNDLMLTFPEVPNPVPWSAVPNVFSKARDAGFNTALVGWYHPYCRILSSNLTSCSWQPLETKHGIRFGRTWFERMVWLRALISTIPLTKQLRLLERLEAVLATTLPKRKGYGEVTIPRYRTILEDAGNVASNPAYGLIFVHLPIPHPPGLYDHILNDFVLDGSGGYLGNLELVDRTIGVLRQRMEKARLWDNTVILITSDHPYRIPEWQSDWTSEEQEVLDDERVSQYVPFLLKLAGQRESIAYDRPLNSIVIPDLVMALLEQKLNNPKSVVEWLAEHHSYVDDPKHGLAHANLQNSDSSKHLQPALK